MGISENFNSFRPILFELCKNNYKGGQINPPLPSNKNRVKGSVREKRKGVFALMIQTRYTQTAHKLSQPRLSRPIVEPARHATFPPQGFSTAIKRPFVTCNTHSGVKFYNF